MLLDDDVVAERKAQSGPFARRLCREEWIEHFFLHVGSDAGAVIADSDLDPVTPIASRGGERRFTIIVGVTLTLDRRIEPVRDHIEKDASDFLRIDVHLAGRRIERSFERDVE